MLMDVTVLPRDLRLESLSERTIVVLDVLRATTSMTAALAAGVREIRIFRDLSSAIKAASACGAPHLLCGERNAVKPAEFDLGNSPSEFTSRLQGQVLFMSTTNGTSAIAAARGARTILLGALVNARAIAQTIATIANDVTLLCAGTDCQVASEDLLGAGAVIEELQGRVNLRLESDVAWIAAELFRCHRQRLPEALSASRGGQNVIRAGSSADIEFAARLNSLSAVAVVHGDPPIARLWDEQL